MPTIYSNGICYKFPWLERERTSEKEKCIENRSEKKVLTEQKLIIVIMKTVAFLSSFIMETHISYQRMLQK